MAGTMPTDLEEQLYRFLADAGIDYQRHEHPPVYTVPEAELHWEGIPGAHCKNLFLRNKKGNHHYLVILLSDKTADLHKLTRLLGEDRLSFGSPERLMEHLRLTPGAVSPFSLIHNHAKDVRVVIDQDLKNHQQVSFHPNVNTATITISLPDFTRFLTLCGQSVRYFTF
jgi:Ala-tRNA(Pro) deacylase